MTDGTSRCGRRDRMGTALWNHLARIETPAPCIAWNSASPIALGSSSGSSLRSGRGSCR